jgi:hypothetical protein
MNDLEMDVIAYECYYCDHWYELEEMVSVKLIRSSEEIRIRVCLGCAREMRGPRFRRNTGFRSTDGL